MKENKVIELENPVKDILTLFLRESAQKMLKLALEIEVNEFIESYRDKRLADGRRRVVKNGYLPEREIQTGIGSIAVKVPRIRDREAVESKLEFTSYWVPKHMRRTMTLEALLPILYLKGISTNDFQRVLEPVLGKEAVGLSPSVISRLKAGWLDEYQCFLKQDMSQKSYVYWWVDGIYLTARMEESKTCMLVIVGADETGKKELVGLVDGFRESKESWLTLLRDLSVRGLKSGPKLSIGDGSLGFWGAMSECYPETKWQRCWVHKTRNVLDKLPKSLQEKAKSQLHNIYQAETKKQAVKAFKHFVESHQLKYPKAVACLQKSESELLTFYDFPAEHWPSIRTTNPIESTFATVRHRTVKSKGCFSRDTIMASVFKLLQEAQKRWKKLYGHHRLADVVNLVKFIDGISEQEHKILQQQNQQNLRAA